MSEVSRESTGVALDQSDDGPAKNDWSLFHARAKRLAAVLTGVSFGALVLALVPTTGQGGVGLWELASRIAASIRSWVFSDALIFGVSAAVVIVVGALWAAWPLLPGLLPRVAGVIGGALLIAATAFVSHLLTRPASEPVFGFEDLASAAPTVEDLGVDWVQIEDVPDIGELDGAATLADKAYWGYLRSEVRVFAHWTDEVLIASQIDLYEGPGGARGFAEREREASMTPLGLRGGDAVLDVEIQGSDTLAVRLTSVDIPATVIFSRLGNAVVYTLLFGGGDVDAALDLHNATVNRLGTMSADRRFVREEPRPPSTIAEHLAADQVTTPKAAYCAGMIQSVRSVGSIIATGGSDGAAFVRMAGDFDLCMEAATGLIESETSIEVAYLQGCATPLIAAEVLTTYGSLSGVPVQGSPALLAIQDRHYAACESLLALAASGTGYAVTRRGLCVVELPTSEDRLVACNG